MSSKEDENIFKEAIKIINSNKLKASGLRKTILTLNQDMFTKDLNFQIIQFLGEFEYDLKTLIELMNDFKNKIQSNYKKNINLLKKELNTIKKENISFKELLNDIKTNKNKQLLQKSKNTRNGFQNMQYKNITSKVKTNSKIRKITEKPINSELYPLKKGNFTHNSFHSNQINFTNNNVDNKHTFYDYNTFLS